MYKLSLLASYIKDQRHIFGVCNHCKGLFRLVDVKISYKTPYREDWYDEIQNEQQSWEEKIEKLKSDEKELKSIAIEKATRTKLPRLLKKIIPTFANGNLNAHDVKTIFHPIDFIAFDGLNKGDVKRVCLMDKKTSDKWHTTIQQSISDTIKSDAMDWKTVRIGKTGEITIE